MNTFLKVSWSVKFRAMGITFGSYKDSAMIPLNVPLQPRTFYHYDQHGVVVTVDLVDVTTP